MNRPRPLFRRWSLVLGAACIALCAARASHADPAPRPAPAAADAAVFDAARDAIDKGAFTEAIDGLELLADRGFVHPDASFNRGIAYLGRARSAGSVRGDRGRAIAGFRETLLLRPDDRDAEALLAHVREELAREQARTRSAPIPPPPSVKRVLVGLVEENTWALLAVVCSAVTALGLALRALASRAARRGAPQGTASSRALIGVLLASAGGIGLLLSAGAASAARSLRLNTELAVVVVPDARLLDERGRPLGEPPLAEGTEVYVARAQGTLARLENHPRGAWVRRSDLRVLATPP